MSQAIKDRPNPCAVCYYRALTPLCSIDNHVVAHVKDNLMYCVFCEACFDEKTAFANHLLRVHFPDAKSVEIEKE